MNQSNTQAGAIVMVSGEDLSAKEGYLAEIRNASGVAKAYLPDVASDYAFYLITEGGTASGDNATLRPFEPSRNHRVVFKGACVPGDALVLADPSVAADRGKLRKLPITTGTYRIIAIAEEAGADGQWTLVRPALLGTVSI